MLTDAVIIISGEREYAIQWGYFIQTSHYTNFRVSTSVLSSACMCVQLAIKLYLHIKSISGKPPSLFPRSLWRKQWRYHLFEHPKYIREDRPNSTPEITTKRKIFFFFSCSRHQKREERLVLSSPAYSKAQSEVFIVCPSGCKPITIVGRTFQSSTCSWYVPGTHTWNISMLLNRPVEYLPYCPLRCPLGNERSG